MSGFSRRSMLKRGAGATLAFGLSSGAGVAQAHGGHHRRRHRPIVIGHRGAPAYRPEHTFGSYTLAIGWAPTTSSPISCSPRTAARGPPRAGDHGDHRRRDHPEFADRKKTVTIDGVATTGWFTRTSRWPSSRRCARSSACPTCGQHNTLQRALSDPDLPGGHRHRQGCTELSASIPETKHPTYFKSLGFVEDRPLLDTLRRNGLDRPRREGVHPVLRGRATSSA